jgi:hypothetical protein
VAEDLHHDSQPDAGLDKQRPGRVPTAIRAHRSTAAARRRSCQSAQSTRRSIGCPFCWQNTKPASRWTNSQRRPRASPCRRPTESPTTHRAPLRRFVAPPARTRPGGAQARLLARRQTARRPGWATLRWMISCCIATRSARDTIRWTFNTVDQAGRASGARIEPSKRSGRDPGRFGGPTQALTNPRSGPGLMPRRPGAIAD